MCMHGYAHKPILTKAEFTIVLTSNTAQYVTQAQCCQK